MFNGNFPPTTNRADWTVSYQLIDSATGDVYDLSAIEEILIEVRDPDSKDTVLSGTLSGDDIILTDGNPETITVTIASPAVVTWTAHDLEVDDIVIFQTSGALPTGITAGTVYYVLSTDITADTFKLSTSVGGTPVTTTGIQSGTHTAQAGQIGLIQWTFAEALMNNLCAKTYEVGGTMTDANGAVTQIILARLPVVDGIVR